MRILRLFAAARRSLPRVIPLMRDAAVPLWLKVAAVFAAVLIVSPLDVFEFIPVLGILDDVTLLLLASSLFVILAERMRLRSAEAVPMRRTQQVTALRLPPG